MPLPPANGLVTPVGRQTSSRSAGRTVAARRRYVRNLAVALASVLLAACSAAAEPLDPKEQIAVWLGQSPRTIAVSVAPVGPEPVARSRDHKIGKRLGYGVGGGVYGAVRMFAEGCTSGGQYGCVAGLLLSPIGFVIGAIAGVVSVESETVHHPLDEVGDASSIFETSERLIDLQALLGAAVLSETEPTEGSPGAKHILVRASPDTTSSGADAEVPAEADALLAVTPTTLGLSGDVGDNPSVALLFEGHVDLRTRDITAFRWTEFTYEGSHRRVSEWLVDDARLFREEIAAAAHAFGARIVRELNTPPSDAVLAKVAAARERAPQPAGPPPGDAFQLPGQAAGEPRPILLIELVAEEKNAETLALIGQLRGELAARLDEQSRYAPQFSKGTGEPADPRARRLRLLVGTGPPPFSGPSAATRFVSTGLRIEGVLKRGDSKRRLRTFFLTRPVSYGESEIADMIRDAAVQIVREIG